MTVNQFQKEFKKLVKPLVGTFSGDRLKDFENIKKLTEPLEKYVRFEHWLIYPKKGNNPLFSFYMMDNPWAKGATPSLPKIEEIRIESAGFKDYEWYSPSMPLEKYILFVNEWWENGKITKP